VGDAKRRKELGFGTERFSSNDSAPVSQENEFGFLEKQISLRLLGDSNVQVGKLLEIKDSPFAKKVLSLYPAAVSKTGRWFSEVTIEFSSGGNIEGLAFYSPISNDLGVGFAWLKTQGVSEDLLKSALTRPEKILTKTVANFAKQRLSSTRLFLHSA
jgi:hypothetical protein